MRLFDIFQNEAPRLFWVRLDDDQVLDGPEPALIGADEAYFTVRLKEMYLRHTRTLWRKSYPLLHGFVNYGTQEDHAIVGPGQLRDLTTSNLDRVIILNSLLSGPVAYKGGDVSILIGLFSVPGDHVAVALIETVSSLAGIGGIAAAPAVEVVNVMKEGVDRILGLDQTTLQLGVRDTFYQNNPLRSGYYVGINASDVDPERLWLRDGRLVAGGNAMTAGEYDDHDYLVIEVEKLDERDDWPRLPGMAEFQARFSTIMRDGALSVAEKREKLRQLWPEFTTQLDESPFLVKPHRKQIELSVSSELRERLEAMETGNPFEPRAWAADTAFTAPEDFDLAAVPNYLDMGDLDMVALADETLAANPFG